MRYVDWEIFQRWKQERKPEDPPWWKTLLQSSAVPLITALLGYGAGVLSEGRQQETYERRLYLEQRMKLFVSTTTNFAGFLENQERLVTFVSHKEKSGGVRSKRDLDQRTKYFQDRDVARDRLWADLDQAQLLFSPIVVKAVDDFRSFFAKHRLGTAETLPPKAEYVARKDAILRAMRDEVNGAIK